MPIDRENNAKGYEPDNCRWATRKVNSRNRDVCLRLEFRGLTLTPAEWAEKFELPYYLVMHRLDDGMTIEQALTTPYQPNAPREFAGDQTIEHNGQSMTVKRWAETLGMPTKILQTRLRTYTVDEAFSKPFVPRGPRGPRSK